MTRKLQWHNACTQTASLPRLLLPPWASAAPRSIEFLPTNPVKSSDGRGRPSHRCSRRPNGWTKRCTRLFLTGDDAGRLQRGGDGLKLGDRSSQVLDDLTRDDFRGG